MSGSEPRLQVPEELVRRIPNVHDEGGRMWLEGLPQLLDETAARWDLRIGPAFGSLTYNYVCLAETADGDAVVLKAGMPGRELATEAAALRWWNGEGAVRLLDADVAKGLLLLERLEPGAPLLGIANDEEATRIAAGVMRRLRRAAPAEHQFPHVRDWLRGFERLRRAFDGGTGPFPTELVGMAEWTSAELLASQADDDMVLHGDLHHWNVLSAKRQPWLAVDPKGVVGEPAYETGTWLRNPVGRLLTMPGPGQILARRIAVLAEELGFERERIKGWGMAHAVLSAWWTYEDHGHVGEEALEVARLLSSWQSESYFW